MRRVVVTGLGAVTPLGVGVKRTWQRLLAGESGIVSTRHLGDDFTKIPSQVAGLVPRGKLNDGGWDVEEHVSKDERHKTAQFTHYALAASTEALRSANLLPIPAPHLTGICMGSGIGALDELYTTSTTHSISGYRSIHPLFIPRLLLNLAAGAISARHDLRGPNHAASTACTTGAHSIGDALRFIQHGAADVILAGSSESCIHPLALGGFARSRSLSTNFNDRPNQASRPFDRDRDGFVIAEGAAVLVLEALDHARARGADIYAELVGYGVSSDAYHLTAPRPDGDGAFRAMRMALREAGIEPGGVGYINAHATGTRLGDEAELRAVKALMKENGPSRTAEKALCVTSTKGAIGHLLGAAGAVEAVFTVLALKHGRVPPTVNLDNVGVGARNNKNNIHNNNENEGEREKNQEGEEELEIDFVANVAQERLVHVALTNSFGFGGTNASLCFRRWEEGSEWVSE